MWRSASAHEGQSLLLGFCLDPGLASTALAEAIAVAVHLEDADVMCQPVEQRASEALGAEYLMMPLSSIDWYVVLVLSA